MKTRIALWLLTAALLSLLVGLGRWQLRRADEKQVMLDGVAAALEQRHAQPLAQASARTALDYAWAQGNGRFIDGPALLLDNQRRGEAVGVEVFRIFQPDDGRPLLVDLGWLPLDAQRHLPHSDAPASPLLVRGLLLPPPSPGLALGPAYDASDRQRWLLTRIDIPALSGALNQDLGPRVLRLDPSLPIGHTRDLDILPNTLPPEKHRAYALQWFSLAAALLVLALMQQFRRKSA
ncbi:SURF1 family protein [Arenimonas sp.]|uniref:SURF1 family protein n=1 Tax=Arenimonas sp. TaxID=1872635 RepID=UPI0039E364BC